MDEILKINNNYSQLVTKDDKIREFLWKALRFKTRNYWHNVRYRLRVWDGYQDFFKKESGKFLTGLLPEVRVALRYLGVDYQVEDNREFFDFNVKQIGSDFLEGIKLYDYQVEYVNQIIRNRRGIVTSPTGSGKTNVLIALLKAMPSVPTLVLANKKSLVDQNYEEIKKWGFTNVGRLYTGKNDPNMITCATVQSSHKLKPVLGKMKAVIVDEIHEMMSKGPRTVYSALNNCTVRVGFSATAFKFGGTDQTQKYEVKGWIGPMFLLNTGVLTTGKLQDRNILSSVSCVFFWVDEPKLPYEMYQDAVTKGIAENESFHELVTKLAKSLTGRTLIIVERIAHGDMLQDRMPDAVWVRGQDNLETRKHIIDRLKTEKGNLIAIATSGIFNTGINVFCHNLINAAGGQAEHQIIQRFGRGLRIAEDKDRLNYFDWYFTINDYLEKHSKARIKILEKEGHAVTLMSYQSYNI